MDGDLLATMTSDDSTKSTKSRGTDSIGELSKSAAGVLAREEYDFSEVTDDELECCLYYEYLR